MIRETDVIDPEQDEMLAYVRCEECEDLHQMIDLHHGICFPCFRKLSAELL